MKTHNIEPLINDVYEIIADRMNFIQTIYGYDLEYQNFSFVADADGYWNLQADNRVHGTVCIGHGWSEEKAEVNAFNNAWKIYSEEPYNCYGNWETIHDCKWELDPTNPYHCTGTELGDDYREKIERLEAFKREVAA